MVKVVASLEGYLYLTCLASIDELCQYHLQMDGFESSCL